MNKYDKRVGNSVAFSYVHIGLTQYKKYNIICKIILNLTKLNRKLI